jgi:hypothetical protein
MIIVFSKERLVFDARDLLSGFNTSIINLPVSIEIKYFEGVAPCGLALEVQQEDIERIEEILIKNDIEMHSLFEVKTDDKEYKRIKAY